MVHLILLIIALILAVVAATDLEVPRLNAGWAAFAVYMLALLLGSY